MKTVKISSKRSALKKAVAEEAAEAAETDAEEEEDAIAAVPETIAAVRIMPVRARIPPRNDKG